MFALFKIYRVQNVLDKNYFCILAIAVIVLIIFNYPQIIYLHYVGPTCYFSDSAFHSGLHVQRECH
jgi:hypothetical protein